MLPGPRLVASAGGHLAAVPLMRQLALELAAPPAPTLDNFVAGRNAELLSVLRMLTRDSSGERFVYLWGPAGCGKSHLLAATVRALELAGRRIAFAVDEQTFRAIDAQTVSSGLAVDDVHLLSEAGQIALFNHCNAVREAGGVLIAAGDAAPARLGLRADLLTRLAWGLVYQVYPLSDEEKAAALAQHARSRGLSVPEEVIDYALTRQRRDLPYLVALLDALDRYSLETKRAVTVPLLRELLARANGRP
jgi:DnaA family protein